MLHDVGHKKTFGKPEPYQHVEHRASSRASDANRSATEAALSPRDAKTGISCLACALLSHSEDTVQCMRVVI